MTSQPRIVVVGDAAVDYTVTLPSGLGADEKVFPISSARSLGGTGANSAVVASALGSSVTLMASVGNDPDGHWVRNQLEENGLATSHVRETTGDTPFVTILLKDSERLVIVDAGVALDPVKVDLETIAHSDLTYLSYAPATAVRLVEQGLGDNIVLGLEAWMISDKALVGALDSCKLVITNEAGWNELTAQKAEPRTTIVETRGGEGVVVHEVGGASTSYPAFPVTPVDATGAGDCFAATLCHFLAKGAPMADAVSRAQLSASLSTLRVGSQAWTPNEKQIEEALRTRVSQSI